MRHGPYNKFDPQKLCTAELAVVTEGDPHATDGKAIYQCFSPGDVKRMATYEDMVDQIDEAGGEAIDNHIDEKVGTALKACGMPQKQPRTQRRMQTRRFPVRIQRLILQIRQLRPRPKPLRPHPKLLRTAGT